MQDRRQFFKSPEQYNYDKVREDLVFTILEKTLLSVRIYHKVLSELEKKYNCGLHDCYEHPEYLGMILKDQHDESYKNAIKLISQQLETFSDSKSIARFLQIINL